MSDHSGWKPGTSFRPWVAPIASVALAILALALFHPMLTHKVGAHKVGAHKVGARRLSLRPSEIPGNPAQGVSGTSLHLLESVWTTDNGKSLRLGDLSGSVRVLALIFTNCPSTCPTLVKDVQSMADHLPRSDRSGIRFVLITIDPERDTQEALRAYRSRMGLDPEHWILLRGDPYAVRELAAVLGFSYGKEEAMEFAHSKLVTVLNPGGEIVHQQADVGTDPDRLMAAISGASTR